MNSLWWHDWLYPKVFTVLAAKAMGVPVAMSSQGVGPEFAHPLDAAMAREMFSACELVGVRDGEGSARILREIGVPESIVCHTGDDALLYEPEGRASDLPNFATGDADRILVGVNLRDASTYQKGYAKSDPQRFARVFDAIAGRHRVHFVFLPISYDEQDDDRLSAQRVVDAMVEGDAATVVSAEFNAAEIRRLCGEMDVAIGISYHFTLFSLAADVPTLLLYQNPYYRQKAAGLAGLYEIPEMAINLDDNDDADLEKHIETMLSQAGRRRRELVARNKELGERVGGARSEIARRLLGAQE